MAAGSLVQKQKLVVFRFAGLSGDGGGRDRTCDLELRRLLLYPLSYAPRFRSTVPVLRNRAARPFGVVGCEWRAPGAGDLDAIR